MEKHPKRQKNLNPFKQHGNWWRKKIEHWEFRRKREHSTLKNIQASRWKSHNNLYILMRVDSWADQLLLQDAWLSRSSQISRQTYIFHTFIEITVSIALLSFQTPILQLKDFEATKSHYRRSSHVSISWSAFQWVSENMWVFKLLFVFWLPSIYQTVYDKIPDNKVSEKFVNWMSAIRYGNVWLWIVFEHLRSHDHQECISKNMVA